MKRKSYYLIIGLLLSVHLTSVAKDTCSLSISLKVIETHNKQPIAELMLYFIDAQKNVQSDEQGLVLVDSLCAGWHQIHVHSFEIKDTTLSLYIEKSGVYELKLDHANHLLNMVEVRVDVHGPIIQSQDKLSTNQLRANAGKNLAELLKNINGLSTINNGATIAKPVIHGMHSNRILMLNNGIRQEDQQWGSEHAPSIDPFVAQQVTVLKGAAGVRYGTDAVGGVVLLEPNPIRMEAGWGGELNLVGMSNSRMGVASAMIEHRLKKLPSLAFRLQASAKQGGNYQIPGGYWVANSGIKEANYSASLSYQKAHKGLEIYYSSFNTVLGLYRGSHTGSQQDLLHAIKSDTPIVPASFTYEIERPRQVVQHQLLKTKAYWDKPIGVWNVTYAYQKNYRQEFDVMRIDNGRAQLNLTLQSHSLNLNLDHRKWKSITGQWGIDAQYQHNTFREGDRVFIPSYYAQSFALYAIERYKVKDWVFEAGLRFDYKHFEMFNPEGVRLDNVRYLLDYRNPSTTLALKRHLGNRLSGSATLSQAWRAPQAPELFSNGFHQGGARIEYGNRNLKPENALGLNIGAQYRIQDGFNAELNLYAQSIQNFIYLSPGAELLTIRGYYKTFNYLQTNALMSGADIKFQYTWNKHWRSEAKAALLRARDVRQNDWIILMPSDRYSGSLSYHTTPNGRFHSFSVGINGDYVLQQKRVPSNFDQIDYPRPPATYFLLDVFCNTDLIVHNQAIKAGLTVSNLLNTKYRDYLDLFRYFVDQPGTNVSVRISVPF